MNENTPRPPMAQNAVDANMMMAAMLHFSTCEQASDQEWTEPKIRIKGNWYAFDFVRAALDHAVVCANAQPLNIRTNPFTAHQETAMTVPAEEPTTPLPAALDVASNTLHGIILVTRIRGNDQHFDLRKVADCLPRMQLSRIKTANVAAMEIVRAEDWEDGQLDEGQELNLHEITGGGQYLVVGEWSYPVEEIRLLLERNGGHLLFDASPYAPPAWSVPSAPMHTQGRHAASMSQEELDAQDGQLLANRTHGFDTNGTGLTRLPDPIDAECADEPPNNDPEYYNRELGYTFGTGYWFTRMQRWSLLLLGIATAVLTISTIMVLMEPHDRHSDGTLSFMAGIIGGTMLTLGIGALGALALDKLADRPLFVECEHQGQWVLWVCGSIIGWSILCAINLIALIALL